MLDRFRQILEGRLTKLMGDVRVEGNSLQIDKVQEANELRLRGNQFLADGNLTEAEKCFRSAQRLNSSDADIQTCLGYTLKELGLYAEARVQLRRAISILGNAAEAFEAVYLLGQVAELEKDYRSACNQYLEALRLKPNFSRVCSDLCRIYETIGSENEIPVLLKNCINASPETSDFRLWYGNWLFQAGNFKDAVVEFDQVLASNPSAVLALCNRAFCLHALNRVNDAIKDYQSAIILDPTDSIIHTNLGEIFRGIHQLEDAKNEFDIAIQLDPNHQVAYFKKGLALLHEGNLADGFRLYEYRHQVPGESRPHKFDQPLWSGDQSIKDKTILIHCEQGLGDTIQFCRYIPLVAARGGRVVLQVQKPLLNLLQTLEGVAQVVDVENTPDAFDFHCPLMSLPFVFKTDISSIPEQIKYLATKAEQLAKWQQKLRSTNKPTVGIVWSGNPEHGNDRNRSIPLSTLMEGLPAEFNYVSLQLTVRASDQATLDSCDRITHFGEELADFTDTAALCELMDVVISVDTSVAHLAAALGRPTWILLPYSVDWRWMLERADSPWYPTARLYRQGKLTGWDDVLQRVNTDLQSFAH